ncbi:hypothetical protein KI387_014633, partial [Taxus chinensis]
SALWTLGSCMIMAQSGLCGISVNSILTRPSICPLKTRKTRLVHHHSVGHGTAADSFSPFRKGYKPNGNSISPVTTYSFK